MKGLALAAVTLACAWGQGDGRFQLLGEYQGLGGVVASLVGPGPTPGSERLYQSYLYAENTIDVLAIDPDSGVSRVFANPAKGEYGARCMTLGPDGKLYLGTLPNAHFLELDPRKGELIDLGRPSSTEQYIWDVAFGADGKLYGATYPQAKLVRWDPASRKLEDLGRMDPVEQYAHFVAGSSDGFVYVGIGTSKANIAAYRISTGEHREILPAEFQSVAQASVHLGGDGNVYATVGDRHFRLKQWIATQIPAAQVAAAAPRTRLRDGREVYVHGRTIRTGTVEHRFDYPGNSLPVFRIGFGPDRAIYGSSVLPIHFLKLDEAHASLRELGDLGGGEIYSFLAHGGELLMAAYAGAASLMAFDPARVFDVPGNPRRVTYPEADSGWRPQAMIEGPDRKIYLGSVAGYGKLGGPLTVWDSKTNAVDTYPHVVDDQSVVTLAVWKGLIVGGTTTGGGGGSHPTAKEARLFLWDPVRREKLFETVPVSGATAVNDLVVTPEGEIFGIAGGAMFVFDPETRTIKERKIAPFTLGIYNSAALGPGGRIWGLAPAGIFTIDTRTREMRLETRSPRPITAGFALDASGLYFVSGSAVYRYRF